MRTKNVTVGVRTATDNDSASVVQFISKKINLHPSVIKAQYFASIPLKSNQKTDYSKLLADFVGNVAGNVESNAAKRKESGGKT